MQELKSGIKIPTFLKFPMLELEQLKQNSLQEKALLDKSGASYPVQSYRHDDIYDKYTENDEFETLGDNLLDFSESNPFGTF